MDVTFPWIGPIAMPDRIHKLTGQTPSMQWIATDVGGNDHVLLAGESTTP